MRTGVDYVWTRFVEPIARAVWTFAEKVSAFLRRVLGPIISLVQKVQGWLLTLWRDVVSPILDAIGAVRLILQLLGRLGLEWAVKADAWLADLERRIVSAFGRLTGWVNGILDYLTSVTTPQGLLNAHWLFASLHQNMGTVFAIVLRSGLNPIAPEKGNALVQQYPPNFHSNLFRELETGEIARKTIADEVHALVQRITNES